MGEQIQLLFSGTPGAMGQVKNRLTNEGAVAMPSTPEAFGQHIVREMARWQPVVQSGRVKAD